MPSTDGSACHGLDRPLAVLAGALAHVVVHDLDSAEDPVLERRRGHRRACKAIASSLNSPASVPAVPIRPPPKPSALEAPTPSPPPLLAVATPVADIPSPSNASNASSKRARPRRAWRAR